MVNKKVGRLFLVEPECPIYNILHKNLTCYQFYEYNTPSRNEDYVYLLIENDKVNYVGRTRNLKARIFDHKKDGKTFSKVYVFDKNFIEKKYSVEFELALIRLFKPTQNILSNFKYTSHDEKLLFRYFSNSKISKIKRYLEAL